MNSYLTEDFLVYYRQLPAQIRDQARKAYRLWRQNPRHPSLRFKRVHTTEPIYAACVIPAQAGSQETGTMGTGCPPTRA